MKHGLEIGSKAVGGAQAIRRAMDVLRAVAQFQRGGATLSRVARAADLNQSTAFRILRSLVEERMLYFDEGDRTYHLGLLAFELGLATQGRSQVQDYWRPAVEQIAQRTRLTTYLMARSGDDAVCLLCAQGATMIRAMPMDVGQRVPLGIGAGSMAILATLEDEEIGPLLDARNRRRTVFPAGTEPGERTWQRIARTREQGFSMSSGTVANGLSGIGVAVVPRQGLLQLAISVSAVADCFDPTEARQIAATIANAIKARGVAQAA